VKRLLKFLDQVVLETQFGDLFGEWVKEDSVKDSQSNTVKLCRPRFWPVFTRDPIMSQALQANMKEELLKGDVCISSSLVLSVCSGQEIRG
jgi:hypothetical protein